MTRIDRRKRAIAFILAVLLCFLYVFDPGVVRAKVTAKPEKYTVTLEKSENGSIMFTDQEESDHLYAEGEIVQIYVQPETDYMLERLIDADTGKSIVTLEIEGNRVKFSMPGANLAVKAKFSAAGTKVSDGKKSQEESVAEEESSENSEEKTSGSVTKKGEESVVSGEETAETEEDRASEKPETAEETEIGEELETGKEIDTVGEPEDAEKTEEAGVTENAGQKYSVEERIWQTLNNHMDVLNGLEDEQSAAFGLFSTRGAETTEIQVRAKESYLYADYNLGTGETRKYEVDFTDPDTGEERTVYAYCIQPQKKAPGDCVCKIELLSERKITSRVIYYGTTALSGEDSFWSQSHFIGGSEPGLEWIVTHIAASKASGDPDWDYKANSTAKNLANDLIEYASTCEGSFPDAEISFSKTDVTAYFDTSTANSSYPCQRTPAITFQGSSDNKVTINLPEGITCRDADSNFILDEEGEAGRYVQITGGTSFYFTAPLDQAGEVSATFKTTVRGSIKKTYQAYKLTITYGGDEYQNLGMIMGTAVPADEREASLTVHWLTVGDLHIEKLDGRDREKLAGATFNLLDKTGNVVTPTAQNGISGDIDASGLITVQSDGCADVKNIPMGTYSLIEITAPVGYMITDDIKKTVQITGGVTSVVRTNTQVAAGIKIQKYDSETGRPAAQGGATFASAKFRIVALQSCKIGDSHYVSGDAVYTDLLLDKDGYAETPVDVLTEGRYRLEETGAPTGYLVGGSVEFAIAKEDHGKLKDITSGEVTDPPIRGGVKIKKVDMDTKKATPQGDASLAGAKFVILSLNEKAVMVDGKEYGQGEIVHTLTIGEDGTAQTNARLLPYGTYAVQEAADGAPKGYLWNEKNYHEFEITQEGVTVDLSGAPMEDMVIRGGVKIKKVDKDTMETVPQGNAALRGARFEIINLSEHSVEVGGAEYSPEQVVYTLVTGEDGVAQTEASLLPYGAYAVREASDGAPEGYLWNENNYREFTITQKEVIIDLSGDPMEDPVIRGGVRVAKYDGDSSEDHPLGGASLENMEIVIYNESQENVYVSGESYQPGEIVHVMYTDADGCAETPADLLPYGSYRLVETAPPEGYLGKNEDDRGIYERTFDIVQDGKIVDKSGWENSFVDFVKRGDLSIHKVDSDTQKSMAGVAFRVTSVTTGEAHVFTTDANGYYSTASSYTLHSRNTNGGGLRDGMWFGLQKDGSNVDVDDAKGALPYDTYRIEELPGENNKGMVMFSDILTISEDDQTIEMGTIENKEIAIGTTAKDSQTGTHDQIAGEGACIVDTVFYQNLNKGVSYTLKGSLVDRNTGETLKDADGNPLSAEKTFKPTISTGSVDVEFVFDASGFIGKAVVVFEELYEGDMKLAEHKDIEDEGQTIYYPGIGTQAIDEKTGTNISCAQKEVTLIDTVSYTNLQVGRAYSLTGTLMVKETGEAYVDTNGKPATASKIFIPETSSGTVEVMFTFNGVCAAGQTLVAFEELSRGGQTYAVHTDINDEGQSVYFPGIGTTACVESTGEQVALAETPLVITDTVSYTNLRAGQEYRLTGALMVKEIEKALEENGVPVTAEMTFVPDAPSGTVDMRFVFNAENLAGNRLVVFEELYIGSQLVASHTDPEDEGQTVYIPAIQTNAVDSETEDHLANADGEIMIVDTVAYTGLKPGKTYKVTGMLMDQETGKALEENGQPVISEKDFVPEEVCGTVEIPFTFSGSALAGRAVVAFETVTYEGRPVAVHADITDEAQTVYIPKLQTTALDGATRTHKAEPAEKMTITDTVTYSGLIPGNTYSVKGVLMDRETGEPLKVDGEEVWAEESFQPVGTDGTIDITFQFKGTQLGGRTVVAFETLSYKAVEIAAHRDIQDEEQSVEIIFEGVVKGESVEEEKQDIADKSSDVSGVSIQLTGAVKTGDTNPVFFWILMGVGSLGLLTILLAKRKKEQ